MAKEIKGLTVEIDGSTSKLTTAMNKAVSTMRKTETAFKDINKSIKLDPTNVELYVQKQEVLNGVIKDTSTSLKKLEDYKKQIEKDPNLDKSNQEYQRLILNITKCKDKLKEYRGELTALTPETQAMVAKWDMIGDNLDNIASKTKVLSRTFQTIVSSSVEQANAYEVNIANIRKVIKDLSDETVKDLKQIAVSTGSAFEQISEYATIGATLGIAEKDIASFTKAMVDLETATNGAIIGEDGAKAVARFLNVLGIGTDQAENFGSAITYVGDQFAATADEILTLASQVAGISTIANVSQHDLIGLSAEMKNLGLRTASSASAITRSFLMIENSVSTGSEDLEVFANAMNISVDEFSTMWRDDAMEAFLSFVDALGTGSAEAMDSINKLIGDVENGFSSLSEDELETYTGLLDDLAEGGNNAAIILKDLGLSGVRTAETLLKLAGNGDIVRQAIQDSQYAWQSNTALIDKASTMYETTAYQLKSMFESLKQAGAELGGSLTPALSSVIKVVQKTTETFSDLSPTTKQLIGYFSIFAAALSPTAKGLGTVLHATSDVTTFMGKLLSKDNTEAVKKLGSNFGNLALDVGAVAIALAAVKIYEFNQEFYKTSKQIEQFKGKLNDAANTANKAYYDSIVKIEESLNKVRDSANNLDFQNGKVDTTTEAYKNLNNFVSLYNQTLDGVEYHIDETTGKLIDQNGAVKDLTEATEELRLAQERQAWLETHREEYQLALQEENSLIKEMADQVNILDDAQQNLIAAGWSQKLIQEWRDIQSGAKDAKDATDEYNKKIQELDVNTGMADAFSNFMIATNTFDLMSEAYSEAKEVVDTYNQIDTAPLEEVSGLISQVNAGISINIDDYSGLKGQLDEVNAQIDSYIKLQEKGFDVTNQLNQLNTVKQKIEEDLAKAPDAVKNSFITNDEIILNDWNTTVGSMDYNLHEMLVKERRMTVDVYFDYHGSPEGSYSTSVPVNMGGGSGGFGNVLEAIRSSISDTLVQSDAIHNKPFNSGGHGSLELQTTININNNGANLTYRDAQMLSRTFVDLIDEKLGGRI